MRSTTTRILLVLTILLGGYIYLVERKLDQQSIRQEKARRALRFDPSRVSGLRLSTPTLLLALERNGADWWMTQPYASRANASEVARILDELELLMRSDVITGRQQRDQNLSPADFGFTQPRARITLRVNGEDITLLIGRDSPLGGTMFLKLESEQSIFAASTNLLSIFPQTASALRERRLFLGPASEFTRLEIRRPDGLIQLTRTEQGAWRLQKPVTGRAAYAPAQKLLERMLEAQAVDFVAESIAASALYGLDEPVAQITLAGARAYGDQILRIGRAVEGRTNEFYAAQEGSESVFTVDAHLLESLNLNVAELRDPRLITLTAYDIGYIRSTEGERAIGLSKSDNGGWSAREPRAFKADDRKIQALIAEWTGLRIEGYIENQGTNLNTWGLDKPARQIVFARKPPIPPNGKVPTSSPDDLVTISISRTVQPGVKWVYAKLDHESAIYQISSDALAAIPMQPLFYREPGVLSIQPDSVRSITRSEAGIDQSVERTSGTNEFRAVAANERVDAAAVAEILDSLERVEAVDFVAEEPDSLEMWGLTAPRATLTIGLTGQGAISKSIIIGDEAGPDKVFAMIRGQGLVFTLSKAGKDRLFPPLYLTNPESLPLASPSANDASADH